ncbi:MAG: hypothetical protein ACI845_002879 [Gammaproteobacteria bacterium]|jgi:hypothetical protein
MIFIFSPFLRLRDCSLKARKLYEIDRYVVASAACCKLQPKRASRKDVESQYWIELSPVGLSNVFSFAKSLKEIL